MKALTRFLFFITCVLAVSLSAAPARPGWIKAELTSADGQPKAIPLGAVIAAGGQDVADYGSFRIVTLPANAVDALARNIARFGVRLRQRDEMDRIDTPGASIDVRSGIDPNVPPSQLIRSYPQRATGLFLLQMIGPAKAEWLATLRNIGWTMARYLPSNAYVVAGPPELMARTRNLSFVQFLDFYHPFEKDAPLPADDAAHDVVISIPNVNGRQGTIGAINSAAIAGSVQVTAYEHETYIRASLTKANLSSLLHDPLIISIEPAPMLAISDERQATSVSGNVNAAGSQPTSPAGYLTWLVNHCSACSAANMPASTWRVGLADTGLDGGTFGAHHPDLAGRENWGGMFVSANDNCANGRNDCDVVTHGTLTSGIIAGNASSGLVDGLGYYDGMGIAPSAGIYMTKIFSNATGAQPTNSIYTWAPDAIAGGATIQNHSWNNYGDPGGYGRYTLVSRQFDIATRDADNNSATGLTPILLTVSAGNRDLQTAGTNVIPPATAKNVISMGGLENYRPDQDALNCKGTNADDFRNLMAFGRHGTQISGYFKPDLVTPASMIVSTKSQWNPSATPAFCNPNFDGNNNYQMESGTSFAAPVAAGAALLVKRYLGSTPSSVSPALAKAALIAGAHSVRGGIDQVTSTTIGAAPNAQQGFGRLSLDTILTGSTPPVFFDEATSRQFTTTGQTWTTRLAVRDSAKPVVIALVWTDAPGTEDAMPHPTPAPNPLVNDLNLTVRPVTSTCSYLQGNSLQVVDTNKGEESISYACSQSAPVDGTNNVEYARFFVSGYTQFDVNVVIGNYGDPLSTAQPFALLAVNADLAAGTDPVAPQLTASADATTPSNIHLSWTTPMNVVVNGYDVSRGATVAGLAVVSSLHAAAGTLAEDDNGRPSGVHTWVYKVTALTATSSVDSNIDIATTANFNAADDTLDVVRAVHFTRLMDAVNAVRAAAGLGAASFTSPAPDGTSHTTVLKEHLKNLRDALDLARDASHLNLPALQYEEPTSQIIQGQTTIKHKQIEELRAGVQ